MSAAFLGLPLKPALPSRQRVKQWAVYARLWYLYDARWQCPYQSAQRIEHYLSGKHKAMYTALQDVGDHVVVINTRHVAMPENDWTNKIYFHHTGYPGGASYTPAWEIHERDPTKIMWKEVYSAVDGTLQRRYKMARLHLFPDDVVPPRLLLNIADQMRGVVRVPRKLEDFSPEEIERFPKLFDWPKDYIIQHE